MRKTKIIITLGPAITQNKQILRQTIAHCDGIRLNFSHLNEKDITKYIKLLRNINRDIPIIGDISGPKIRIVNLPNGQLKINKGDKFSFIRSNFNFPEIFDHIKKGDKLLLDDAKLKGKIVEKTNTKIVVKFLNNHLLLERKGIAFPDSHIKLSPLSETDKKKILVAIKENIDYFFLSFVNNKEGILELKKLLHSKRVNIPIIAKIETAQGVKNYREIILNSDGVLVARGDLGIEVSLEKVPIIQKKLVSFANNHGKLAIVATQVLDSMIENPTPLRAEMSDIVMMVEEKVDAIMLTAETSIGKFPLKTLNYLQKAIIEGEKYFINKKQKDNISIINEIFPQTSVIAKSIFQNSEENGAKIIANISRSGLTSLLVSKYRPKARIITLTDNYTTFRKVRLYWNTTPLLINKVNTVEDSHLLPILKKEFKLKENNIVLISRDQPINKGKVTNSFSVYFIKKTRKKVLNQGPIYLDLNKCILCNRCIAICPYDIFRRTKGSIKILHSDLCIKDKLCVNICPEGAIKII